MLKKFNEIGHRWLVLVMILNFHLVIVLEDNKSATTEAEEKISTVLKFLNFRNFFGRLGILSIQVPYFSGFLVYIYMWVIFKVLSGANMNFIEVLFMKQSFVFDKTSHLEEKCIFNSKFGHLQIYSMFPHFHILVWLDFYISARNSNNYLNFWLYLHSFLKTN